MFILRTSSIQIRACFDSEIDKMDSNEYSGIPILGQIDLVEVSKNLFVCNLFGQYDYGYNGDRYTAYGAWEVALPLLKTQKEKLGLGVYFPYLIGCDRGGADWGIINRLINDYIPDATICYLS